MVEVRHHRPAQNLLNLTHIQGYWLRPPALPLDLLWRFPLHLWGVKFHAAFAAHFCHKGRQLRVRTRYALDASEELLLRKGRRVVVVVC